MRKLNVPSRSAGFFPSSSGRTHASVPISLHVGPATHLLHVPMNTIEAVLDADRFLRIHRSHIVNVRRIAELCSIAHGQYVIVLKSGQRLQSGRTYGERIRSALANPF